MADFASLKQSCILFEATFEHHDLEKVNIEHRVRRGQDTMMMKKSVPQLTGKGGIEALLYCEYRFRSACRQMGVTDGADLFNLFEEIMQDTAESTWETIAATYDAANRTAANFEAAIQRLYLHYFNGQARDTMLEYLRALCQPVKTDPR